MLVRNENLHQLPDGISRQAEDLKAFNKKKYKEKARFVEELKEIDFEELVHFKICIQHFQQVIAEEKEKLEAAREEYYAHQHKVEAETQRVIQKDNEILAKIDDDMDEMKGIYLELNKLNIRYNHNLALFLPKYHLWHQKIWQPNVRRLASNLMPHILNPLDALGIRDRVPSELQRVLDAEWVGMQASIQKILEAQPPVQVLINRMAPIRAIHQEIYADAVLKRATDSEAAQKALHAIALKRQLNAQLLIAGLPAKQYEVTNANLKPLNLDLREMVKLDAVQYRVKYANALQNPLNHMGKKLMEMENALIQNNLEIYPGKHSPDFARLVNKANLRMDQILALTKDFSNPALQDLIVPKLKPSARRRRRPEDEEEERSQARTRRRM